MDEVKREILLVRHGRPAVPIRGVTNGRNFTRLAEAYDSCGLAKGSCPPAALVKRARECGLLLSSDLARAHASAQALAPDGAWVRAKIFREMELPLPACELPMPVMARVVLLRTLWLAGYHRGCESYAKARARAAAAAEHLDTLARQTGKVMLMGHGMMNRYIAHELRQRGWVNSGRSSYAAASGYWSYRSFST